MTSMPAATIAAFAAAAAPLLLLVAALSLPDRPRVAARLAPWAAWGAFGLALVAAVTVAAGGPAHRVFWRAADAGLLSALSLSTQVDALSAAMLLLVSFVGAIVARYSRRYLDGNARQAHFSRWLLATLAAVLSLVVAGNLVLLALAWVATSLALHQLLVFYPERDGARMAARKKFVFGRAADACVVVAVALAASAFGGIELDQVLAQARALGESGGTAAHAHWIAGLVAVAAIIKSAQFPFHGWLPEVMETPTPVSALLHAGIVNAGGFLIVRLSPLMTLSAPALDLLLVAGAFTALFAAAVMLTQSSVKSSLAWSTCAQMGFMLMQCGLGAFSTAVLHIVAHSLYKAHAFLGAGSIVDAMRAQGRRPAPAPLSPARLALAFSGALGLALLAGVAQSTWLDAPLAAHPGSLALAAILAVGVTYLLLQGLDAPLGAAGLARVAGLAAAVCFAYFALAAGARALLAGAVAPDVAAQGVGSFVLPLAVVAAFVAALLLQAMLPTHVHRPRWRAAYVHLLNGFYVNARIDQWLRRQWPLRSAPTLGDGSRAAVRPLARQG